MCGRSYRVRATDIERRKPWRATYKYLVRASWYGSIPNKPGATKTVAFRAFDNLWFPTSLCDTTHTHTARCAVTQKEIPYPYGQFALWRFIAGSGPGGGEIYVLVRLVGCVPGCVEKMHFSFFHPKNGKFNPNIWKRPRAASLKHSKNARKHVTVLPCMCHYSSLVPLYLVSFPKVRRGLCSRFSHTHIHALALH